MVKRVVIAGSRNYFDYTGAKEYIDLCLSDLLKKYEIIIVSGGCSGADMLGEKYAKENGLKIERYEARWYLYGKSAGPKRNGVMAKNSDYIICFWDGKSRGTKSMIDIAKKLNKPLRVKIIKGGL
ncbi:MAG: DUF2493 domain-containing protein [Ruminococcus sp.]|nr:DUF2493 domain-containing protein [Ruminococcus sp.]